MQFVFTYTLSEIHQWVEFFGGSILMVAFGYGGLRFRRLLSLQAVYFFINVHIHESTVIVLCVIS